MTTVALGDVAVIDVGLPFRSAEFSRDEEDVRLLRGDNVSQGRLDWSGAARWSASAPVDPKYTMRVGDVVVAMDRPWVGAGLKRARVQSADVPSYLVQRVARLRARSGLDQRYLALVADSVAFSDYLLSVQTGTAIPHISGTQIGGFRFVLPPLLEQRAIAEVLGALDDKIAANTALAERVVGYTDSLFFQRFGERRLDTQLGALVDVVDCLHSKKPERFDEGRLLMQLNNIRDDGLVDTVPEYRVSEVDYARWSKKFETRPWDLVITNVGRIGAVARVPNGYQVAIGRNMTGIRPRDVTESGSFLAAALHSSAVRREIEQRTDAGSVMSALNVRSIPLLRLQSSTADERRSFHEIASSIFESADVALRENRTLAATRDALLPQLMSGKLRVRDAEAAASAAGV